MSDVPSFERFDYLLRANKQIERKLVFDLLSLARSTIGFKNHRYLGFGSMWFGDFRLAHRILEIDELVSIERTKYAERADFNRPYGSIKVVPGECSDVLASFNDQDWLPPYVAWFDYDGRIDECTANDLGMFLEKCAVNSVIVVTVNSSRNSYRAKEPDPKKREDTSVAAIEHFLGSGVVSPKYQLSPNDQGVFGDISHTNFPAFLAECLMTFMGHKVSASSRANELGTIRFIPLFSFSHKDGVEMITVGGAITANEQSTLWRGLIKDDADVPHKRIDLIPITIKEKMILDACHPHVKEGFVERVRSAGIKIADEHIEKYREIYRHFPVFVESMF